MTSAAEERQSDVGYRRGLALVLLAGVCWSSMGLMVRLMEAATVWQILFYRSIALALFLFLVLTLRSGGRPLEVYRRAGLSAVLGGLALVLAFAGGIFAVVHTTVANAMFLLATAPFFAALLARLLLRETVRRATWIAMAAAALGVAIMVAEGIGLGHLAGNLAAMLSALGFALFTIALRWKRKQDMLPAVSLGGLFAVVIAGGVCLATGQSFAVPAQDVALAFAMGVFQVGAGLIFYTLGSKGLPAAELALLSMTEVVLGPFWVWLFLGETAGPYTLLGGAVLLAAIAGNALTRLRHRPPPLALP